MITQLLKSKEEFEAWLKLWRPVFYKSKVILEADKEELVKEFTEQQLALIQEIKKQIGGMIIQATDKTEKEKGRNESLEDLLKELDNIKK